MTRKTRWKCAVILALMGVLCAGHAFAQAEQYQATIFLIGVQKPFMIPNFTINDERFYGADRQGKGVKLAFRDLKEIRFLNPGKNFEAEVIFNDGRSEAYSLQPAADIVVTDGGSEVHIHHLKVARIQFSSLPALPPPAGTRQARAQPRPGAEPVQSDWVVLRNGDSLSGQVQTKTFPLRTAYGTFQLEAAQIASIEFDATRPNMALVLLKNGDRLSGTVEMESVRFTLLSGEGVSFDGKTIQRINFKR